MYTIGMFEVEGWPKFMNPVSEIRDKLYRSSKASDFAGQDPFDGLNSKLFDYAPFLKDSFWGLLWIQFFKRSKVNFRRVTGVPNKRNPKGIGLFILGLIEEFKLSGESSCLTDAMMLADWLLDNQCDKNIWKHSCWGYHFDWKARAFFVPKGKPNVITTIYVSQALYALSKELRESHPSKAEAYKSNAFDSASFIVNELYSEVEGRCFFAYIPGEKAFVHNASLWAAAWVSVVARVCNDEGRLELALKVARQSVAEQNIDGSWVYGARHHHQFIDGFHTGYNLEALDILRKSLSTNEFDSAIDKGFLYYKENFFDADGTVKYYNNDPYPLDPHSVSQAIITLIKLGNGVEDLKLVDKVVGWSISNLYLADKEQFVYQITSSGTNKINYMRWTQAWMYYAFSFYLSNKVFKDETN